MSEELQRPSERQADQSVRLKRGRRRFLLALMLPYALVVAVLLLVTGVSINFGAGSIALGGEVYQLEGWANLLIIPLAILHFAIVVLGATPITWGFSRRSEPRWRVYAARTASLALIVAVLDSASWSGSTLHAGAFGASVGELMLIVSVLLYLACAAHWWRQRRPQSLPQNPAQ